MYEVVHFDNNLMDPNQPQLFVHPSNHFTDVYGHAAPHFHSAPSGPSPAYSVVPRVPGPNFHSGLIGPPQPPPGLGPRGPVPNFGGVGGQNYGTGPNMYQSGNFVTQNNFQREDRGGNSEVGRSSGGGLRTNQGQPNREVESGVTQPPMMTFNQFLTSQNGRIDNQEAMKKYNEYKWGFRQQQINVFFVTHKDEEWFKIKYHPEESTKQKAELTAARNRRLEIFMDMFEKGALGSIRINQENSESIIRFLDTVVIKLEGGTELDLKALDEDFEDEERKEELLPVVQVETASVKQKEVEEVTKEAEITENPRKRPKTSHDSNDNDESSAMDETKDVEIKPQENEKVTKEPKPKVLHKTCSIYLQHLVPSITKQEVEAMCKRFPGFLRVAFGDPKPERRFQRTALVTFDRSVNIKELYWNLNRIKLRGNELSAVVNSDLRRIRSVNGISSHKQVVRADIKLAARMVQNLDRLRSLWDSSEKDSVLEQGFMIVSKNPLLKNISDYLIEEGNAEEELLGVSDSDSKKDEESFTLQRDEALIQVLDRLLLYLRVVHSIDYYNSSSYSSEDELPNRCGIMHVRGTPPSSRVTQQEIIDYIAQFEQKSNVYLQVPTKLKEEVSQKLGKKDLHMEVEKFLQAYRQQTSQEKWLCPLSGDYECFSEFVRGHILNKHADKIRELKTEMVYFNNYLMDPERPQLPDHPSNCITSGSAAGRIAIYGNTGPHSGPSGPPPTPPGFGPTGPGPNFGGGVGGQNYGTSPNMHQSGNFVVQTNFQ